MVAPAQTKYGKDDFDFGGCAARRIPNIDFPQSGQVISSLIRTGRDSLAWGDCSTWLADAGVGCSLCRPLLETREFRLSQLDGAGCAGCGLRTCSILKTSQAPRATTAAPQMTKPKRDSWPFVNPSKIAMARPYSIVLPMSTDGLCRLAELEPLQSQFDKFQFWK